MAPSQLPAMFNPTSQDIEMMLAAQVHLGSRNMQVSLHDSSIWSIVHLAAAND